MPSTDATEGCPERGLVKVARTQNGSEGAFVQGLLLAEGVPSVLRRAPGFDVPDFLAAGPRDVLVSASAEQVAREVLLQADTPPVATSGAVAPARLLAGLLIGVSLVAIIVWLATLVV